MKKHVIGIICLLLLVSVTIISWKAVKTLGSINHPVSKTLTARDYLEKYVSDVYTSAHLDESGMQLDVFKKALTGFINLKLGNKIAANTSVLTVVDLSKSSCEKRMWIIDVANKSLILKTWVAHGHGSGDAMATRFSDRNDSHESSLGFYLTDDIYFGKHGRSLRLDGLDAGFNANARARAIVVHAADYVSENNILSQGYLGRSYGCPAVAPEVLDQVIDTIKNKTVLFISGNSSEYTSKYLDEDAAASFVTAFTASVVNSSTTGGV